MNKITKKSKIRDYISTSIPAIIIFYIASKSFLEGRLFLSVGFSICAVIILFIPLIDELGKSHKSK